METENKKVVASHVGTSSLHLACFIATVGGKLVKVEQGPDKTRDGKLLTRWDFNSTPEIDQAMALWQAQPDKIREKLGKENMVMKDWGGMNFGERASVVDIMTAFSHNLRHFIGHTHGVGI
jgi:hypothetical protein